MVDLTEDLAQAFDAAQLGFARLGIDECFEGTNAAFANMLGRQPGDLKGQHWRTTVHPADECWLETAYVAARAGRPGYAEVRGMRADESVLYQSVTVTPRRNSTGDIVGFNAIRYDISTRLDPHTGALKLAVELAPNGLLLLDPSGRILLANQTVDRLFGYGRQELVGQMVEVLLPESLRRQHEDQRTRFNRDPSIRSMDARDLLGRHQNGQEIPLQVYLNRIEAPQGTLIVCTIIDIAERVRYQEQCKWPNMRPKPPITRKVIPGPHESRNPHAYEPDHGHERPAAGIRSQPTTAWLSRNLQPQREAPAASD
ncbi:MAG: PAS domain S-box protein [Acidobacteriota bacterium]